MNSTNRIHSKSSSKAKVAPLQKQDTRLRLPAASFNTVYHSVGLSAKQAKALSIIIEWEKQTLASYCKAAVLASMNASFGEMVSFANDSTNPVEKEWALKFLPLVKPLFPKSGRF